MLESKRTSLYKSEIKKIKNKKILEELKTVLSLLIDEERLPDKYLLHPLIGNYAGYMECHIRPDILLIFNIEEKTLYLYRIGSHSKLFK
ncbi:MAG: type II toxin-antitoxin system YafQ family toxin [Rickettsiales bacterium]|jgi:mRNA interferase YafQ|nr:type II toxin-antitoxin system YafQ family toxin [Rickettsiales bacterium]